MLAFTRSPVVQFAASGLLAMAVICGIAFVLIRETGTDEAIRDAERTTTLVGQGVVRPALTPEVLASQGKEFEDFKALMRDRVLRDETLVRVKIWTADGRVVYSNADQQIGTRHPLGEDELEVFRTGDVVAELSDLDGEENVLERRLNRRLLEVYLPLRPDGTEPVLFEAYQDFDAISSSGREIWLAFAPALFGGLLLLQLVNLPLAHSLVARLRRAQKDRETLLRRALDASQTERRLIAADLHDGVVQDLVGVSYALAAHAETLNGHGDRAASAALTEGAAKTRDSVRALRSLLVNIYPPSLHRAGLAAAVGDLATTHSARGLRMRVAVADDLNLDERTEQLLFRVAQESLRNVQKHADADHAEVTVRCEGDHVVMEITDDGRGFEPAALEGAYEDGHLGLRALEDLVADADGRLEVRSTGGGGTTVRVEVPR